MNYKHSMSVILIFEMLTKKQENALNSHRLYKLLYDRSTGLKKMRVKQKTYCTEIRTFITLLMPESPFVLLLNKIDLSFE